MFKATLSCIDLLPQDKNAVVRDTAMMASIKNLLSFITKELVEAVENFYINRLYSLYDPHVGETSCQIRGYTMLKLSTEVVNNNIYKPIFRLSYFEKMHKILISLSVKDLTTIREKLGKVSLEKFIDHISCLYKLTPTEGFLLNAYVLTKYKTALAKGESFVDYDAISKEADVSRKLTKKFTRHCQIVLASMSCANILSWAEEMGYCGSRLDVIKCMKFFDDDNREVLPCYFYSKILIKHLMAKRSPVILKARQAYGDFVFFYSFVHKKFTSINCAEQSLSASCFVIEGDTHYNNEAELLDLLNKQGLERLFLLNMASHPQYSGEKLSNSSENPFNGVGCAGAVMDEMKLELEVMQEQAVIIGCSKQNAELFLTRHVYCDTIENQVEAIPSSFELSLRKNLKLA